MQLNFFTSRLDSVFMMHRVQKVVKLYPSLLCVMIEQDRGILFSSSQYSFLHLQLRDNQINATSLLKWLEQRFAIDRKLLVLVLHAVDNVVHITVVYFVAFEERSDSDSVNQHSILRKCLLHQTLNNWGWNALVIQPTCIRRG